MSFQERFDSSRGWSCRPRPRRSPAARGRRRRRHDRLELRAGFPVADHADRGGIAVAQGCRCDPHVPAQGPDDRSEGRTYRSQCHRRRPPHSGPRFDISRATAAWAAPDEPSTPTSDGAADADHPNPRGDATRASAGAIRRHRPRSGWGRLREIHGRPPTGSCRIGRAGACAGTSCIRSDLDAPSRRVLHVASGSMGRSNRSPRPRAVEERIRGAERAALDRSRRVTRPRPGRASVRDTRRPQDGRDRRLRPLILAARDRDVAILTRSECWGGYASQRGHGGVAVWRCRSHARSTSRFLATVFAAHGAISVMSPRPPTTSGRAKSGSVNGRSTGPPAMCG